MTERTIQFGPTTQEIQQDLRKMPSSTQRKLQELEGALEEYHAGNPPVPEADPDPLELPRESEDKEPDFWTPPGGTIWDDPKVRNRIEDRLTPLTFDDLLNSGRVSQKVKIREGLNVVFQSLTGNDGFYTKQKAYERTTNADAIFSEVLIAMRLSIGIQSINGRRLPEFEKDGTPDDSMFEARWGMLANYPEPLLVALSRNQMWFEERLRKLTVYDDLKNG